MRLLLLLAGLVRSDCVDQELGKICLDACDKELVECMLKLGYNKVLGYILMRLVFSVDE